MDGLADAVAEELERGLDVAVTQILHVGEVEVGDRGAGLEHGLAGLAGTDHHAPDLALLVGGVADHGRAGHVGAVLLHVAEDFDPDHVACLDRLVGRRAVGDAAAHAGPDLTLQAVAAALQHHVADDLRDRFLGHPRPDLAENLADHPIGERADLREHGDLLIGLDHAGVEVELAARHELGLRQPLAEPDVVLRRHVIELDRDLPRAYARFQQRISEHIRGILRELVVGADIGEARALLRQVLLDVDHDLGGEVRAGKHRDGAAEAIAGVARDQETRAVGDVVLGQCDERVVPGLGHG